jgi:D-alanyl-D-alanine dipeptidase
MRGELGGCAVPGSADTDNANLDIPLIRQLRELSEQHDYAGYLDTLNRALAKVRTEESGEPLVRLSRDVIGPRIFIWLVKLDVDSDESERLQLRASVVQRLKSAAESLPTGYSLIIRDAFRTARMIWDLYRLYMARLEKKEPQLSEYERDLRIRNLLAMPDDPVPPGHMTGGAVDINLGDVNGNRVDLELKEDVMPRKLQAPTFCAGLPDEIVERRSVLFQALSGQGFHNYSREYWHYSYGDAYWAVRRQDKTAIYGLLQPT